MSERFYVLSEIADKDLEEIFDYSVYQFGFEQAEKYFLEIEDVFQSLILNPYSGKKRDEIKPGLYSFPKDSHIIFYRIMDEHIRIIRVLHGSRDFPNHL